MTKSQKIERRTFGTDTTADPVRTRIILEKSFTDTMAAMANPSGIRPTEFKVLILPVEFGDKIGSIFVPDEHKDRAQFAQMEGVIIALAPLAFTYDEWKGVEDQKPKPGDKVLFAKFAGFEHKGKDGKKYRVVNDKDVSAVLE